MAVYKPSNCTPFLTCLDLTKSQDITCELNTSNELVTGYKIKILDNNNDVIFEGAKFDPINPDGYENSGLNGSTLTLPLIIEGAAINNNTIGYQNGEYNIKDPTSTKFDATRFSNGYINQPYKWEIILEQGNTTGVKADKYYDMTITQGKVLGSTKNRIQSYLSENIYKDYFIQLDSNVSKRVLINSYDHTYGYLYPQENKFTDEEVDAASYFEIYKFSNDPDVIAAGSQVAYAIDKPMNKVVIGDKTSSIGWGSKLVYPYYFEQVFEGLSRSYTAQNDIPNSAFDSNMDGFLVAGTNVMVKGETAANAFNGIFTLNSVSEKEREVKVNGETKTLYDLTLKWLRSTPGNTWANLTNAVFYVQHGTEGGKRWQVNTDSQTVGTINQTPVIFIPEKPVEIYTDETKGYENSKTRGKIFKNTISKVYIRPFAGVVDGMRFSYLENGSIQYQNVDIQSIDTETWAVSGSIGSILTPDVDQYKITSYFKGSDENPFYAYSNPVLSIESDQWEKNPDGSYIKIKNTEYFKGLKRYITVKGDFENRSWVNYQWFLTDLTSGYVQISEKKYRGDIEHTFYGLETEHYYVVRWVIEDEYGILWEEEQFFKVEVKIADTEFPFNVNFECETQSVLIDFIRNAVVVPDPQIYDYEYFKVYQTDENGDTLVNVNRVPLKVKSENEKTKYYRVLNKYFNDEIYNIEYKQTSNTSGYLKLSDIKDVEKFKDEQLIKYERTKIDGSDVASLNISAPTTDDCVLNSEHVLNPNFTGDVISYEIDTNDVGGLSSYISLTVSSQPSWVFDGEDYIPNEDRNKLILTAFKNIGSHNGLSSNIPIYVYKKNEQGEWVKDNSEGILWGNNTIVSAYVDPSVQPNALFDYIKTTYLYQNNKRNENYKHILGEGKYNSNSARIRNPILKYEDDIFIYTELNIWYDNYTEIMEQKVGDQASAINVFGPQWNWDDTDTWKDDQNGSSGIEVYRQVLDVKHSGKENINKYKITLNIAIKNYNNENLNNDTAWTESVVANAFVEDEVVSGGGN